MNYIFFISFLLLYTFGNRFDDYDFGPDQTQVFRWWKRGRALLVNVKYKNEFLGGGALYTENIVITLAMYAQLATSLLSIELFPYETKDSITGSFSYNVLDKVIHPSFQNILPNKKFNIAILKLNTSSNNFPLFDLDEQAFSDKKGIRLRIVGWGWVRHQTSHNQNYSLNITNEIKITQLDLPVQGQNNCFSLYARRFSEESEFCSGYTYNNQIANDIMLGSPLFFKTDQYTILVGLFSWSDETNLSAPPIINVKISALVEWIKKSTKKLTNPFYK